MDVPYTKRTPITQLRNMSHHSEVALLLPPAHQQRHPRLGLALPILLSDGGGRGRLEAEAGGVDDDVGVAVVRRLLGVNSIEMFLL